MAKVGIIMGSKSDYPVMKEAENILKDFGIDYEIDIVSAHRTPEKMMEYSKNAHKNGISVIIAGAGGAAQARGDAAADGRDEKVPRDAEAREAGQGRRLQARGAHRRALGRRRADAGRVHQGGGGGAKARGRGDNPLGPQQSWCKTLGPQIHFLNFSLQCGSQVIKTAR